MYSTPDFDIRKLRVDERNIYLPYHHNDSERVYINDSFCDLVLL